MAQNVESQFLDYSQCPRPWLRQMKSSDWIEGWALARQVLRSWRLREWVSEWEADWPIVGWALSSTAAATAAAASLSTAAAAAARQRSSPVSHLWPLTSCCTTLHTVCTLCATKLSQRGAHCHFAPLDWTTLKRAIALHCIHSQANPLQRVKNGGKILTSRFNIARWSNRIERIIRGSEQADQKQWGHEGRLGPFQTSFI